jgi:hypothetical protein
VSFFYPHVVQITRAINDNLVGDVGYSGELPSNEQVIAQQIPAAIQRAKEGRPTAKLPGDVPSSYWKVIIPLAALANGTVQTRDIVTDEAGVRYAVSTPYWNSLGYTLVCERLEV